MPAVFSGSHQPCMCFMEEPSQFSVGQIAQSLTCSIMEKPHTGLDDCLRMLLSCFRKRMSEWEKLLFSSARKKGGGHERTSVAFLQFERVIWQPNIWLKKSIASVISSKLSSQCSQWILNVWINCSTTKSLRFISLVASMGWNQGGHCDNFASTY